MIEGEKHLPKVYALQLGISDIALVGIAMQTLKAAFEPNPLYRLATKASIEIARDAVGDEEFSKDINAILDQIMKLSEAARNDPCPNCGEIHA